MVVRRFSVSLLFLALATFAGAAMAQTWSPEQQEIWRFEEQQWKMAAEKDLTWIDKMVHPNVSYWDTDRPAPQNKASLLRWGRFSNTNATVLEQELFPISITTTGNIAVVQYRYSTARENYKKDRETVAGRYTDVLVKEGGRWLFLAWAGGDDPKK
ncbi:MAG: nuclear transport factor 2 family protein [Acidobacteriota bacterium]|nr:nuclear transport factor 2 family protein [Acidobacteriota bacterium]